MLWFTMDKQNKPIFIENNNTGVLYQILHVIREPTDEDIYRSTNNDVEDCGEEFR